MYSSPNFIRAMTSRNEMGGAGSMYGKDETAYKILISKVWMRFMWLRIGTNGWLSLVNTILKLHAPGSTEVDEFLKLAGSCWLLKMDSTP
jgi:hypothetical protein